MPEKGVCLARCTGELHPDPFGRMYLDSEVLELLLFGERNSAPLLCTLVSSLGIFRLSCYHRWKYKHLGMVVHKSWEICYNDKRKILQNR